MASVLFVWFLLGALVPVLDQVLVAQRLAEAERVARRNGLSVNDPTVQALRDRAQLSEDTFSHLLMWLPCLLFGALFIPVLLASHVSALLVLRRAP